ncbi:MAG TPA: adenylate/guanylate cyclase domain-containing protein [Patescibacteria group bacterium]|nr:adenylate/guanylate cyclase domain-containing protein [Patescibacteria group bacterium]
MSRQCPTCGVESPAGSIFCASCGTELPAACPRCSTAVSVEARFCPTCGLPLGAEPSADERKLATVVFVDLVDSTALAEHRDPERVRAILQSYFSTVASTVQAWGGSVEKYIGDAVVAVFGVPRIREDDPARGVSAALEIAERVGDLAADLARRSDVKLRIRVGVNTGDIIAPTEVRADRPMVTGDAVNVAARLQTAAGPGEVLVGHRTFQATRAVFTYAEPMDLTVKGRTEPVVAHRLVGRVEGAFEAGPARNLQARVIGRERELAVLGGLLDLAIESRSPRLGIVYGPAGIGKSRLVREAVALAASERPDLTVLRGRCPAVDKGITFWPLAEIVRSACGISLDDGAERAAELLRERAGELLARAGLPVPDVEATVFALATTAGIALPDNPLDRSRPLAVSVELARRWPQYVAALASRGPTVIVIEDLHWASNQFIGLVEHILTRSTGATLIVVTARPEFAESHPSFAAGRPDVVSASLGPLSRSQSSGLLDGLLPDRLLDPQFEEEILATAEGNPLFIEEIVTRLVEVGSLVRDDGRWRSAGSSAGIVIPDTIHGLLAARIDGLPDAERRVLREAAVIGRIFWDQPVALAIGVVEVADPLAELERRGLVTMRPMSTLSGQLEYSFKHALIRDVAYAGLSMARRAAAHAAVAEWLSTLSSDGPGELAELIAVHYERALADGADLAWASDTARLAEVRRGAMGAFLVAGATARQRYALDRAVELHERAVELALSDEDRAIALEQLGDDHDAGYDGDRALPPWDKAMGLRRQLPDPGGHIARLTMKIARMGAILWGSFSSPMEPDAIDGYVDAGLAADPDPDTRAWLLLLKAAAGVRWTAFHRTDPVRFERRVSDALEAGRYAELTGNTVLEANVLHIERSLLINNGDVAGSIAATRRQLLLADHVDDPRERHFSLIEAANTLTWVAGEAEAMIEPLRLALLVGRELRPHDVNHSTLTLMSALYLTGRWDEVPAVIDEHIRAFEAQVDTSCPFAMSGFPLGAVVLAQRGEVERARVVAGLMPPSDSPIGMIEACQAMAAIALGDPAGAKDSAKRVLESGTRNFSEEPAIELAVMLDALAALEDWDAVRAFALEARARAGLLALAEPTADRAEGLAAASLGLDGKAVALLERAIAGFDGLSSFEAARTREALAGVDPDRRAALLSAALQSYDALGARPHADRARAALVTAGTVDFSSRDR